VSLNQVSRVEVARVYNTGDGVLNLTLTWVQTEGNLTGIQVDPAALSLGTNESKLVYLIVNATSLGAVQGEVEIKPSTPKANATETGGTILPMFTVEANITVIKPTTVDTGGAAMPPAPSPTDADLGFLLVPAVGGAAALALLIIISKLRRTSDRRPSLREMDKTRRGGKQGGRRKG
jgi:hypothetical protein